MDRRELEIMLNEAFDRGIVSVGHLVHETVEVGFLNELGRTVGFTLNGWKEAIETIPVDLFDSFDDGRGREWFLSDCKALGGKVPQNTYRGELVSALADVLMVEEAAPALGALESALDSARRKGYCVFDRGVHGDVPADGLVYLCSTYPAAVGLKDSLDSIRAQGNDPDTRTLGVYRMVDGYCIMGGLDSGSQADAYAVDADLAEGWGVGDAAFRIADLKAKTFSYAVEAGEAQGASTLVYYTDEGADPVLFQQTDGDWRLASDNFLAENAIVEDLEQAPRTSSSAPTAARTSSSRPAAFARIWAGPVSIRSCRFRNRTYAYTYTYTVAHTHTRTMEHMHVGISTHMHIAAHAPIGLQPRWAPCFRPFSVSGV